MGAGFGFSHMLDTWSGLDHFSLGGILEYNVTGKFGGASEIVVPASLEFARHFGGGGRRCAPTWGSVSAPTAASSIAPARTRGRPGSGSRSPPEPTPR